MGIKQARKKQEELNERRGYIKKVAKWKFLKARGDVQNIADLVQVSTVIISKAVNHGIGSLRVLRAVDAYYAQRETINK